MKTPARTLPVLDLLKIAPRSQAEWWVPPVGTAALVVFAAVPIIGIFLQPIAGRIVWTIVIAALPLFIVLVGYHRWRRICPLAFVNQIPVRLRRPGTRRASPWLQAHYYYISFVVFLISLWIRLIATNGSGVAIAVFFVAIALAALVCGVLYTGKTWCNYICPLSFIEKVYTEPHGLRETANSQCGKCTACKPACPDINEENGYWKDIESTPKKFVYYAYPGLIFAFYFYYFLQAGTWDYYFGGSWTNEQSVMHSAFLPGHAGATAGFYFASSVPRALAAFATLAAGAVLSFLLFSWIEPQVGRWLRQRDAEADSTRVRHVMLTITAFTAFVTFYAFAGQPTLRAIAWAPQAEGLVVVMVATLFLVRRLRRTSQAFAEQTLARGIIKRWEWADMQPPKDLHAAYLIHTARAQEKTRGYAQLLAVYQDAVRDVLADRLVTREQVERLASLRGQLQIKNGDHEKIMAALAEEERARLNDPLRQPTAEKRLQLATYAQALAPHLDHAQVTATTPPDDSFVRRLRVEYRITPEEHAAVLRQLLGGAEGGRGAAGGRAHNNRARRPDHRGAGGSALDCPQLPGVSAAPRPAPCG